MIFIYDGKFNGIWHSFYFFIQFSWWFIRKENIMKLYVYRNGCFVVIRTNIKLINSFIIFNEMITLKKRMNVVYESLIRLLTGLEQVFHFWITKKYKNQSICFHAHISLVCCDIEWLDAILKRISYSFSRFL